MTVRAKRRIFLTNFLRTSSHHFPSRLPKINKYKKGKSVYHRIGNMFEEYISLSFHYLDLFLSAFVGDFFLFLGASFSVIFFRSFRVWKMAATVEEREKKLQRFTFIRALFDLRKIQFDLRDSNTFCWGLLRCGFVECKCIVPPTSTLAPSLDFVSSSFLRRPCVLGLTCW